MTLVLDIITPTELAELRLPFPRKDIPPYTIEIHLLFPLSVEPETLHESKEYGTMLQNSDERCLDISSLCRRWRHAWAHLPSETVERVIFNVALPELPLTEPSVPITEHPLPPPPGPITESSTAAAEREAV